uniref:(northern house mosquito) hypothetical protein n=1 Tax=Culex pipiens TaxID=7175 RepID=A0A8D8GC87_CULPI
MLQHFRRASHRHRPGSGTLDARGQLRSEVLPLSRSISQHRPSDVLCREERPQLFARVRSESNMRWSKLQPGQSVNPNLHRKSTTGGNVHRTPRLLLAGRLH